MDVSRIDLLMLIGKYTNLKKVAATGGGEYHGSCPMCGGVDRLHVQPANRRWACRQCTPHWQDAIAFLRAVEGVDFKTAVNRLGLDSQPPSYSKWEPRIIHRQTVARDPQAPQALRQEYPALTDPRWQFSAHEFIWECTDRLWTPEGEKALQYLIDRGLSRSVISDAYLGYNSSDRRLAWGTTEVWLPRGITIPWHYGRHYWRVNIRRPVGSPKYIGPAGCANGLYQPQPIRPGAIVVMVEGEFDALLIRSQAPLLCQSGVMPVATGTASWGRILRWVSLVSMASLVLLAFDNDTAGQGAAEWWQRQLGRRAIRLEPQAHDVTDMWKSGQNIQGWLTQGIDRYLLKSA